MGHRNIQFTGHITNEADQGIFYSGLSNFPQPNIHPLIPPPINHSNFEFHHIQEHPFYYGTNFAAPSSHYNPHLPPPPSGIRDFPIQVNHGAERFHRNIPYMDGVGESFKRKNAEVAHPSYPYQNGGPSSSVAPMHQNGNPWLDMNFGTFAWTQPTPNLPYVHGYQVAPVNRSAPNFITPISQGAIRYNPNNPPQVATAFLGPVQPTGFRLYPSHRREITINPNGRYRNLPHLRVLPEDEVAVLEIPGGYREAGDSVDQHRDMRLDIDHMSYEELLALGENIGTVGSGLTDEFIRNNLKTRIFSLSPACTNQEELTSPDHRAINFCVVCQNDYEYEEKIGTLDCGHEYHRECINKWLHVKNTCPVCKSTALRPNL
ncbi:hypothetical protein ACP275_13G076700 [Erythranthe tilingii]